MSNEKRIHSSSRFIRAAQTLTKTPRIVAHPASAFTTRPTVVWVILSNNRARNFATPTDVAGCDNTQAHQPRRTGYDGSPSPHQPAFLRLSRLPVRIIHNLPYSPLPGARSIGGGARLRLHRRGEFQCIGTNAIE